MVDIFLLIPIIVLASVIVVFYSIINSFNGSDNAPSGTISTRPRRDRVPMKKKGSPVVIDRPVFMSDADYEYGGLGPVLKAISRAEDRYVKALKEKPLVRKIECAYCGQTIDNNIDLCPRCGGDTHG